MPEPLERIADSILTAQSIAHHALYELGDENHQGAPRECTRPLCKRLMQDAADVDRHARAAGSKTSGWV